MDTPYQLDPTYLDLREMALSLTSEDMAELGYQPVLAVIMELSMAQGVASIVSTADGSASLYLSNGRLTLGLGEHEKVRHAGKEFQAVAFIALQHCQPSNSCPLPQPGYTSFHIITPEGKFTYTAPESAFTQKRDTLSPLYLFGQQLLTQMRLTGSLDG
ncbi:hypothetical protein SAMN02745181_0400 [Rubritalea squalenifaciens DSM 18772]|uniref:Uncharacterized protein n=1 Tax=Rubritalea squalenifaciens DSM 18772 TaxID=1123071 RepID=A0A1M6C735_9BACT|nr:hypothetical protein SAMN02745181_0400 [Rubritalea squalenifaciens DSM 18772]